jgi:DNA repair exonuclease SbcCD nuclease subunit
MGDTFDSRKGIDFSALSWAKNHYYDRLKSMGCSVITVVGNHTAYYKNTNDVNAVDLLLREYSNVRVVSDPEELNIHGLKILFIPWINDQNKEKSFKMIQKSNCKVAMGHLELNGFSAYRGHVMDHGYDGDIFAKYEKVFSGHYHTRSSDGKIFYLGNPYEIYWNDVNDTRGFHIFDTETLDHTPVNNPYKMFHNIYYEDTPHQMFDVREYQNKIVKIIVRKKSDQKKFEKFVDKLYTANVAELKVVENFQIQGSEEFEAFESEDTLSILNRYIQESESNLDKSFIQKLISEIYQEACELV